MFEIEIDNKTALGALERLVKATTNREPVMRDIAAIMVDAVEENFAQEGRPKWQGLKPPGRDGGKILQKSGRLASSITPDSDNDSAMAGTNVKYAPIQNCGGTTRPHEIRPRNKQALKFGGRYAKKVNHPGSKIPAREFLSLEDSDAEQIETSVADYLGNALG